MGEYDFSGLLKQWEEINKDITTSMRSVGLLKRYKGTYAEKAQTAYNNAMNIINETKEGMLTPIQKFRNLHKQPNRFEKYKVIKF